MAKDMNMNMALFMAQSGACFYCGCEFEGRALPGKKHLHGWSKDHVKPLCKGNNAVRNSVLACLSCNAEKKDREPTRQEFERAQRIWTGALRYLKAFNGNAPPMLKG